MNREDAIKKVEGFVPKDKWDQRTKEELLRFLEHKDHPSYHPIDDALSLGLKEVGEFLILSGCDVDESDDCCWSPLMYAINRNF